MRVPHGTTDESRNNTEASDLMWEVERTADTLTSLDDRVMTAKIGACSGDLLPPRAAASG